MFKPESPNTMFQLLYTRYGKCVGIWIYDNGCKVLEYLLNREPHHFKSGLFFIDRLHFKNHVGCSHGHSAHAYDCFQQVNTQAAEQGNLNVLFI